LRLRVVTHSGLIVILKDRVPKWSIGPGSVLFGILDEGASGLRSRWLPPLPDPSLKGRNVLEVAVSPRVALAAMVRRERLEAGLSQREAAARMGIKHLRQYQKLEDGGLANAELETLARLKRAYPRLSVDAILA
jgi:hypothetical protein